MHHILLSHVIISAGMVVGYRSSHFCVTCNPSSSGAMQCLIVNVSLASVDFPFIVWTLSIEGPYRVQTFLTSILKNSNHAILVPVCSVAVPFSLLLTINLTLPSWSVSKSTSHSAHLIQFVLDFLFLQTGNSTHPQFCKSR